MDKEKRNIDLLIIGAGCAGLTAAIYAGRSKLKTVVLEEEIIGGQIRGSYAVDNYPGFVSISGNDLADKIHEHALRSGVIIDEFDNINSVNFSNDNLIVETNSKIYEPKAVILATGSESRKLPVPEEEKFHGNGIHYCELCDHAMYEGKDLIVVGGGNSGVEGALFLTKYAKSITLVHQLDSLQANKLNQEQLLKSEKVKIIWDSEVQNVIGEDRIEGVTVQNVKTKETSEISTDGIFVYIGRIPKTHLFEDFININEWGYIDTDENMLTNVKGVYAAGDVRSKTIRQLTTAASDGTIAALMAEKYILEKGRTTHDKSLLNPNMSLV